LFLELIRKAHDRGIKVVIDGVFNHTGRDFFAFRDIRINGASSPYADWFTVQSFDDPETRRNELRVTGWAGFFTLPEFRNNADGSDLHPGPKQYIFHATKRWMDPDGDGDPGDGIDGWRLDVSEEVPDKFWREWNAWFSDQPASDHHPRGVDRCGGLPQADRVFRRDELLRLCHAGESLPDRQ
jgi:Glycosidases